MTKITLVGRYTVATQRDPGTRVWHTITWRQGQHAPVQAEQSASPLAAVVIHARTVASLPGRIRECSY